MVGNECIERIGAGCKEFFFLNFIGIRFDGFLTFDKDCGLFIDQMYPLCGYIDLYVEKKVKIRIRDVFQGSRRSRLFLVVGYGIFSAR